jgi:hypothetical protein
MKKVFLALAVLASAYALAIMTALTVVSCKQANEEMSKIDAPVDSTAVAIDSVQVDSTAVDTTQAGLGAE